MKALQRLKEKLQPARAWLALKNAQIQAKAVLWWAEKDKEERIIVKLMTVISILIVTIALMSRVIF